MTNYWRESVAENFAYLTLCLQPLSKWLYFIFLLALPERVEQHLAGCVVTYLGEVSVRSPGPSVTSRTRRPVPRKEFNSTCFLRSGANKSKRWTVNAAV